MLLYVTAHFEQFSDFFIFQHGNMSYETIINKHGIQIQFQVHFVTIVKFYHLLQKLGTNFAN